MEPREYTRCVLQQMADDSPTKSPEQLPLPFYGKTIDVNRIRDQKCEDIEYWGKAVCVFDNVYRCYANVRGTLCIVEIKVSAL